MKYEVKSSNKFWLHLNNNKYQLGGSSPYPISLVVPFSQDVPEKMCIMYLSLELGINLGTHNVCHPFRLISITTT